MPVSVARRKGIFRIIEATTGKIAKNKAGTAVDGGGHSSRKRATSQVAAINSSKGTTKRRRV